MSVQSGLVARVTARVGELLLDVSLDTGPGALALIGPNGAGKSSLLRAILGALPLERGSISVGSELLFDSAGRVDVPVELRRLGYVPQEYALFPHYNVRENIEFALGSASPSMGRAEKKLRVERLIEDLALGPYAHRSTLELSGGEKQRVALARALAVVPRALLLDEPLAALDAYSRGEVREFLCAYLAKLALPTIVVTHDPNDARLFGQRIAVLEAGRIVQEGTWEGLVTAPQSRFVAQFVAP
jgi:molybdate transport system ATP-binding protein